MENLIKFCQKYRKEILVGLIVYLALVFRDLIKSLI